MEKVSQPSRLRLILRDFLVTVLLCYSYVFVRRNIIGDAHLDKWLLPLFDTLFYSVPCFLVFIVSIRLLKSKIAFAVLSWALFAAMLFLLTSNANSVHLSWRFAGYDLFTSGKITIHGLVFHLLEPFGLMALGATFLSLRSLAGKALPSIKRQAPN